MEAMDRKSVKAGERERAEREAPANAA
uniref:Uncharacterized protein n=1 Tax=Nelumbo nucifera TaxID=4432 RepID=A0A822XLG2_NELNU|nr:TPA_asm: hypothetical protein HUJ06_019841 [Nelumbo nucifera]